jgi:hypothetical protein
VIDPSLKLERILCFQTDRHLRRDYTITLDATYIQILNGPYVLPRPEQHVIVRRYLDDSLHIFHQEQELYFKILQEKPPPHRPLLSMPAPSHPWRLKPPIGKSKRRRYKRRT